MGSWGREDAWQGGSWRTGQGRQWLAVLHLHVDNPEGITGEQTDCATQGSSVGIQSLKTSGYKNLWGLGWQEKLPASQESSLERPTGSWNVHKPTHLGISTRRAQFACW